MATPRRLSHLHHRETVDKDRNVIASVMRALLNAVHTGYDLQDVVVDVFLSMSVMFFIVPSSRFSTCTLSSCTLRSSQRSLLGLQEYRNKTASPASVKV